MLEKFIKGVLKFVNSVVLTILNGYTLATLWGWFVVATFGAPVLTIPAAIGLKLVVKFATFEKFPSEAEIEEMKSKFVERNVMHYVLAGLVLLTGFIVKKFFMGY